MQNYELLCFFDETSNAVSVLLHFKALCPPTLSNVCVTSLYICVLMWQRYDISANPTNKTNVAPESESHDHTFGCNVGEGLRNYMLFFDLYISWSSLYHVIGVFTIFHMQRYK